MADVFEVVAMVMESNGSGRRQEIRKLRNSPDGEARFVLVSVSPANRPGRFGSIRGESVIIMEESVGDVTPCMRQFRVACELLEEDGCW